MTEGRIQTQLHHNALKLASDFYRKAQAPESKSIQEQMKPKDHTCGNDGDGIIVAICFVGKDAVRLTQGHEAKL